MGERDMNLVAKLARFGPHWSELHNSCANLALFDDFSLSKFGQCVPRVRPTRAKVSANVSRLRSTLARLWPHLGDPGRSRTTLGQACASVGRFRQKSVRCGADSRNSIEADRLFAQTLCELGTEGSARHFGLIWLGIDQDLANWADRGPSWATPVLGVVSDSRAVAQGSSQSGRSPQAQARPKRSSPTSGRCALAISSSSGVKGE